ncbi:hypothetical protein F2Q69_00007427 [Brassica cretica]|uniref:Uncharacterized protein n=1 Tax=Brassica cretica TaxID=69181 RepID=A0A8S9P4C6_BRACR|nr:hypothetical protein F2Q69_00007427 [Brassica cretica]
MGFLYLIHYCVLNVDGLGDEFVSVLCSVTDSPSTSLVFCHRGNICLCSCVHIGKVLFYKQTYLTRENAEQREKLIYKKESEAYEALSTRLGEHKFLFEDRSCTLVFCHRLTINKSQVALFSVYRYFVLFVCLHDNTIRSLIECLFSLSFLAEMDSETQRTIALLEARSEYREVNDEDAEFDIDEELSETEAEVQTEAESEHRFWLPPLLGFPELQERQGVCGNHDTVIHGFTPVGCANHYKPSLKADYILKVDRFEVARLFDNLQVIANTNLELPDVVGQIRSVQGTDLTKETTRVVIRLLIDP